jgi:serine/threonine-protein kinase
VAVHEGRVAEVACAVLDGTPIDWTAAESTAGANDRALLRQLRAVETLADFHRQLHRHLAAETITLITERVSEGHMWGHLRVLERIGSGAFGDVYRAWDTRLDREVALKLLEANPAADDSTALSIIEEGRLLARVHHPNVATIYGAEHIESRIGLWMEFVRGCTLKQLVDEGRVFSAVEAIRIGTDLCEAVAAVHAAGLLHRDIKAQNVMLADSGRPVLMDFGTGRELAETSASDLAGTPLYLAPEIFAGREATVQSDLYSLGVLLYHLVTGSFPVVGRSVSEVRRAHERNERQRLSMARTRSSVSRPLARVLDRATDPRPESRYRSADAFAEALAAIHPHPLLRLLTSGQAMGVALILVAVLGWEVFGRQIGTSRTPSALLASAMSRQPITTRNVRSVKQPVIAVLPFKNLSVELASDYFVDGLTDEVIRNLAVIQGLQVRSRTSSFALKDKPRNLHEVGEQLGATLVLDGSVLRSGNKLRINAQLFEVSGEVPLWAERFDRDLESTKDLFVVLDEISRAIVNKLRLRLGRGQRRYDLDLDTYEQYLKARSVVDRGAPSPDFPKAVELFKKVIATDPAFAPAYAGLASAYAWRSITGAIPFETAYSMMRPAAVQALQLDPLLAEAHEAMGVVYSYERAWENSEQSFRKAIELNPTLPHVYTSYSSLTLRPLGRFDEAEQLMRVAMQNDPLSLDVWRETGELQFTVGRYDEAVNTFERLRTVDPEFPSSKMFLARALLFAGRLKEALSLFETVEKPGSRLPSRVPPHYLAYAYVMAGRREQARKLAPTKGSPHSETILYTALGDMDRAFEALERTAVHEPQRVGLLLTWPETAALRADPRLAAFRRRFGLPEASQ